MSTSSLDKDLRYIVISVLFLASLIGGFIIDKSNYILSVLIYAPAHIYGIYLCYIFSKHEVFSPIFAIFLAILNSIFFFEMMGRAEANYALSDRNPALYISLGDDVCIKRNILRSSQNGILLAEPSLKITEFRTWADIKLIGKSPCTA